MRHLPLHSKESESSSSVAAVWPSFEEALLNRTLPVELEDGEIASIPTAPSPEMAAPDVPTAVGKMIVGTYAGLLAVFFAFFAGSAVALFSIVICAFFMAVFFAVPGLFLAVENDSTQRPSLSAFWSQGIQTLTGRTSGRDALVQMMIVPVFVTFGLLAIGIIGKIYIG